MTRRALFALLFAPFLPKPPQPLPFLFVESFDLSRMAYVLNNGLAISAGALKWATYGDFAHLSYFEGGTLRDFCFWFGSDQTLKARLISEALETLQGAIPMTGVVKRDFGG